MKNFAGLKHSRNIILYLNIPSIFTSANMYYSSVEKDSNSSRKIYLCVFYVAASIMAAITMYALYASLVEYLSTGKIVIGEILVTTEFPVKGLSKLITYLMIVSVVAWYCVTKLGGEKVKDVKPSVKAALQLIVLVIAVISLYEFVYNFVVWSSLITVDAMQGVIKLDSINVPYPNPKTPWNLVFATKMSLAAFLISSHGFYIMVRKKKTEI